MPLTQIFETAHSLLNKKMVSVLLAFSTKQMISTLNQPLKYCPGVFPRAFLNMQIKALGLS